MGFLSELKRGIAGEDNGDEVTIAGRQLVCPHCGGTRFFHDRRQLNTAGASFLDLDWANRSADVYACANCGHLDWFA